MSERTSKVKVDSLSDGIVRQTLRMDEDFVRGFPGTTAELELAKGHPDVKARTYEFWKALAKEHEILKPLLERGPQFTGLRFGQDATHDALIARMEAAWVQWDDETNTKAVVKSIERLQGAGSADVYAIGVGEVSDVDWTRRDAFQAERGKLGFGLVPQELVCLAAIVVQERLNRGEHPGVKEGVWYIGDSEPIVNAGGDQCVLRFIVEDGQVFVDWYDGQSDDRWGRVNQFLCSRK